MSGWLAWPLVAVAGALGAVARDALGQWLGHPRGMDWANRTGAVVLGVLVASVSVDAVEPSVALVVGSGFCGGLTTFSTLVVTAIEEARPVLAWRESIMGLVLAAASWGVTVAVWG
ncbi:MAG TPA: CrcB family protein [Nitriliruptoraceae bacterium]|nr:CrcB family protein [Nitriliruptoraceae bacterium]